MEMLHSTKTNFYFEFHVFMFVSQVYIDGVNINKLLIQTTLIIFYFCICGV